MSKVSHLLLDHLAHLEAEMEEQLAQEALRKKREEQRKRLVRFGFRCPAEYVIALDVVASFIGKNRTEAFQEVIEAALEDIDQATKDSNFKVNDMSPKEMHEVAFQEYLKTGEIPPRFSKADKYEDLD